MNGIQSLLSTLPSFLGAELSPIIVALVILSAKEEDADTTLDSLVVKVPSRMLLPTLIGLWSSVYKLEDVRTDWGIHGIPR